MSSERPGKDFIRQIVERDLREGHCETVVTRFPPEPNGYPHIGHAKSITLNFSVADENGGRTHLRFDDTNPTTEDARYVEAIEEAVRWLGFEWDQLFHASDYFERLYDFAIGLIEDGRAYVDSQSEEEIRDRRGTVTEPGVDSPYRTRSVEENLDLFHRMRAGEFPDGSHVLRAKIDMSHPNMIMRDPLLYRIRHAHHYRRGDDWVIYPLYDYAHGLSDAIEGVTHSFCTLEFENNREIYDWLVDAVGFPEPRPRQYEFARLNLDYTIMSKRKLKRLVDEGHVAGWDDPRMPTIAGLRRRGYTPDSIRTFCEMIGVARADSRVDMGKLEYAIRDDLNGWAPRVMAVLDPLPVTLVNWPLPGVGSEEIIELDALPDGGGDAPKRRVPLDGRILIEREDFREVPPRGFHRLVPGGEVWLKGAYAIRCDEVVKDAEGAVVELRCSVDPDARAGRTSDGRRIRGTVHWVSEAHGITVPVRLYDRLFTEPDPEIGEDFVDFLNPESLVRGEAVGEPSVAEVPPGGHVQFERVGYFHADPHDSLPGAPVFNRVVTLKDSWAGGRRGSTDDEGARGTGAEAGSDTRPREQTGLRADREAGRAAPRTPPPPRRDPAIVAAEAGVPVAKRFATLTSRGVSPDDALTVALDDALVGFMHEALEEHPDAPVVANWIVNDIAHLAKVRPLSELPFGGSELGRLVGLVQEGRVAGPAAKEVLEVLVESGGDPAAIVAERGLERVADEDTLGPIIEGVIDRHPDKVSAYRDGKEGLIGFFMGQAMRETGGTADPQIVRALLEGALKKGSG